ncbi:aldehyde dehydrogenase [Steroidobacter sp.]|uniref:aldehyde dehydrogenase n=1 Tax=Steroidobacter sp. TaxID=1978227 RepID=UPI001A3D19ED|nr:aldehyde dehydrogenase [Steroidobacter sp.]MBL8266667.1 aldehyde dehydrogenase [Steroidobacter sp.]
MSTTQYERVKQLRADRIAPQQLYIDGKWRDGRAEVLPVSSPIDGARLTTLAAAGRSDVNDAVHAARTCYESGSWSRSAPAARRQVLLRWAELIESHALELAVLGVRENGTELSMALRAEPLSAAATLRYYAEAIDKVYGEIAPSPANVLGLVHRLPVGVVGAIVPWNFPLMIAAWKLAPALAAGNCVVLKPSEKASLTLLRVASLAAEAGLPAGALNVVTGSGGECGAALAEHDDVDVIAFTGSGGVGRSLLAASARSNLKRVYLELGGKSPNIVFDDAPDLDAAVAGVVNGMFRNSGQVCIAGTRLLLQRSIAARFMEKLIAATERLVVGDPLAAGTQIGAVCGEDQLAKLMRSVRAAESEGAKLVTGGARILADTGGYYMQPTIFTDVTPTMALAREEVFGPVLASMVFDDEAEAVRLANSTALGLAAGVWTSDLSTAHRMVKSVRAGLIHVNCYGGSDLTVPLGGVKQSGNGHDKSLHALDKFTELRSAWMQL